MLCYTRRHRDVKEGKRAKRRASTLASQVATTATCLVDWRLPGPLTSLASFFYVSFFFPNALTRMLPIWLNTLFPVAFSLWKKSDRHILNAYAHLNDD